MEQGKTGRTFSTLSYETLNSGVLMVAKGGHISDETKAKMSLAHKGRKNSEEHNEKLRNVVRTEEWRQNISKSLKGKHPSAEALIKMSESH